VSTVEEHPYVWAWGKSETAPLLNDRKGQHDQERSIEH
jgi:hypothetical protein